MGVWLCTVFPTWLPAGRQGEACVPGPPPPPSPDLPGQSQTPELPCGQTGGGGGRRPSPWCSAGRTGIPGAGGTPHSSSRPRPETRGFFGTMSCMQ